jgi:hypothetical protein
MIYVVFSVSDRQTRIFVLQDDAMIESLLCTLDIFTGLHFGPLTSRHFGAGGTGTGPESSNLLVEALDPLDGFDSFLQVRFKKKNLPILFRENATPLGALAEQENLSTIDDLAEIAYYTNNKK